jgi:hypothetical protein
LKVTEEKSGIRIRIKTSRIRNTAFNKNKESGLCAVIGSIKSFYLISETIAFDKDTKPDEIALPCHELRYPPNIPKSEKLDLNQEQQISSF